MVADIWNVHRWSHHRRNRPKTKCGAWITYLYAYSSKSVTPIDGGWHPLRPRVFEELIWNDFWCSYTCQSWLSGAGVSVRTPPPPLRRRGWRLLPWSLASAAPCDRLPTARVPHDGRDQKAIYSQRKVIISSCAECGLPAPTRLCNLPGCVGEYRAGLLA